MSNIFSKWEKVNGDYLIRNFNEQGTLEYHLPDSSSVYMWKVNPTYGGLSHNDTPKVLERIDKILSEPQGIVSAEEHHSISVEVRIKGKGLKNKKDDIKKIIEKPRIGEDFINFLDALNNHIPSLYVGKANNLRNRIEKHLNDETGFSSRLGSDNFYTFDKLSLFYVKINELKEEEIVAIEHIVTILTLGIDNRRIG